MAKEDVNRYIEFEAPGIAMVENDVAAVVCFRPECETSVSVDPATLVVEDEDAVDIVSEAVDPEDPVNGDTRDQVEIFCSLECRNQTYNFHSYPDGGTNDIATTGSDRDGGAP